MFNPFISTFASLALTFGSAIAGGRLARLMRLPTITGFLVTGMITGPFVLGVLSREELASLQLLDHSGRITRHHHVGGHVPGDYRPGRHH